MYRAITWILLSGICLLLPITTHAEVITGSTGGGGAHDNMQPSLAIHHIIALQGVFPPRNKDSGSKDASPYLGEVSMFAGSFAPRGWALADGQLLPINQNQSLFALLGTTYGGDGRTTFALPDLRGRTAVHPGQGPGLTNRPLGQTFGTETVTLTEAQMPAHEHTVPDLPPTSQTGGSQPQTNMQPSLVLNHTIALQGIFPSRNKSTEPYLGEVNMFAGTFAPRGEAMLDGQLIQISQNSALFAILGTVYGGDGRTTFGLPDLQGRSAIQPRPGPGLSMQRLGQRSGVEDVGLSVAELPAHYHTLPFPSTPTTDDTGGGQAHTNMQPTLGLNHIIALTGIYPSRNKDGEPLLESKGMEPFIGEMSLFAGSFAPRGWAFADGQLLAIASNDALFSILGTTYGGDGRTTFALPDMRGRVAIHPGTGPGLSTWKLGDERGTENATLSEAQMPAHTHTAVPEPSTIALALIGLLSIGLIARRRS